VVRNLSVLRFMPMPVGVVEIGAYCAAF
jgi:hypothetical protein